MRKLAMFGLLIFSAAACVTLDAQWRIDENPALGSEPRTPVSVLGVLRDGRFNEKYWADLEPALKDALGGGSCELGFVERLEDEDQALYARTDAETRDNGITKSAFEPFAQRARGQAIIAFTIYGHAAKRSTRPSLHAQATAATVGTPQRRRGRMSSDKSARTSEPEDAIDLAMTLYSVQRHEVLAKLSLHYTGTNADDALQAFATRLKTLLPGASCAGWKWAPSAAGGS